MVDCLYCKKEFLMNTTWNKMTSTCMHFTCYKLDRERCLYKYSKGHYLFDKSTENLKD